MYVTAILMIIIALSLFLPKTRVSAGTFEFSKENTLPLRGLLAFLIVSHHLSQKAYIPGISLLPIGIGYQIVCIFFFISGYGLSKSYKTKGKEYFNGFFKKRLGKILPKYVFLTIIFMAIMHILGFKDVWTQIEEISKAETPLPFSWFIIAVIYIYIAFYISGTLFTTPSKIGLAFLFAIAGYVLVVSSALNYHKVYWWWTIMMVVPGYYVGLYEKKISELLYAKGILARVSIIIALFVSFCILCKISVLYYFWLQLWFTCQVLAVYLIVRTMGFVKWDWLNNLGKFSMELYMVHGIPLIIALNYGLDGIMLWIVTYSLAIPLAYVLHRYFVSPRAILWNV